MIRTFLAVTVLLLASVTTPLGAQESADEAEATKLEAELSRLNASMKKIVELLERQVEGQQMDLVMKRVELATSRVSHLEGELGRVMATRQSLLDQQYQVQEHVENVAQSAGGADYSLEELDRLAEQAERQLKYLKSQTRPLDLRISELEGELQGHRQEIRQWQDYLDRWFQGGF